jgi:hypothetical protein
MASTCIVFEEGEIKEDVKIVFDAELQKKILCLSTENKIEKILVLDDYFMYFDPFEKSTVQNSAFHMYNGKVFVTHISREMDANDIVVFSVHLKKLKIKGKQRLIHKLQLQPLLRFYTKSNKPLKIR